MHCRLATSSMKMYSKEGDVVFGILAAVHQETIYPFPKTLFTEPPAPRHCKSIHTEYYQRVLAMIFAINEINKNPYLLPNISLGFRIYDSCLSEVGAVAGTLMQLSGGKETIPNYNCLLRPKLVGFIGDGPSAGALPMARILGVSRIPQISYAAALPIFSDKIQFPSFLRTVTSVFFQPGALVELLLHFGWTWIGILASDNDLCLEGSQMLKDQAAQNGICIEFFEILPTQSSRASLSHVTDIVRRSTATVIVCYTFTVHISPVLKEISLLGITGKIWIGVTSWIPAPIFSRRELWETLNGMLGLAVYSGEISGLKDFLYSIHPLKHSEDIFIREFWEEAFSCKWMDVFNKTEIGTRLDGKELCTGAEKLESLDASVYWVKDFRLPFSAHKAVYAMALALHDLFHCRNQEGPFINGSCADPKDFQPWQMLHYVKNVRTSSSADSERFFDSNGDSRPFLDVLYWHVTSNDSSSFEKVGTYDAKALSGFKLVINGSTVLWGGIPSQVPWSACSESCAPGYRKSAITGRPKCCFSCVHCPDGSITNETDSIDCILCPEDHRSNSKKDRCLPKKIDFLSYEEPLGFTLAFISILLFCNSSSILCIFVRYKHTPVVRANNLQLSYILLVALMLCFLCSLVFIGRPRILTCMFRQVIFGISFSLAVSCVMAKTVMVVLAFRATKPNSTLRRWVGSRTSYCIILACSLSELILGVIWLGTAPSFPELNSSSGNWKIEAECNEGSIFMFYCMLGFLGLLACGSFGIAFLARSLPDSFNEAKYITFSMLVFLSVWLSFIPAYLSTKGKYMVAVEIFAILSSGAGLLYCIFIPKIYIIFLRPEMNTRESLVPRSTMCTTPRKAA
ncbi:extracellular calcium-sensing receptor-like [Lissotriton helveticus]